MNYSINGVVIITHLAGSDFPSALRPVQCFRQGLTLTSPVVQYNPTTSPA